MNIASLSPQLDVSSQRFALARPFVISRGSKTVAEVVVAQISAGGHTGRGESVPYGRYGETVFEVIETAREFDVTRGRLQLGVEMRAGAARNALDCALWDLESKLAGVPVWKLAGLSQPEPVLSAFTLSLGAPDEMAAQARAVPELALLKLKLGGTPIDGERMNAVRRARPDARLIADANEAWAVDDLDYLFGCAEEFGFETIEQPLPVGEDDALLNLKTSVSICADESVHTCADLDGLVGRYDGVNIKLDKAGGLTESASMVARARELGFKVMIGSMVSTSLGVAPAMLLTVGADWVDLDGPLLLKDDRAGGLTINNGWITPPSRELWG